MSSTRYAAPGSDPDDNSERHLSSKKLKGINIGLNVVCRVARVHKPEVAAAMIWLTNYANLKMLTADALSDELDLGKEEIRKVLSNAEADSQTVARFQMKVAALRGAFDAERNRRRMVDSSVRTEIRYAVSYALEEQCPVEIIAKTRMGKTDSAREEYFDHMHEAVWINCPSDESETAFMCDLAHVLGLSTGGGKKTVQMRQQIKGVFATGMINLLFVDEGHFLFPADTRKDSKPRRLEFLRELFDMRGGHQGIVILATPQYSLSLNILIERSPRWAPGQWDGRVVRFHCRDTMNDGELTEIARWHAPDAEPDAIGQLVLMAKATEGFAGKMVNAIKLARRRYAEKGVLTKRAILQAQAQMERGGKFDK